MLATILGTITAVILGGLKLASWYNKPKQKLKRAKKRIDKYLIGF